MTYALHFLRRRERITLTIAHLNHRIRGREADGDEEFVRHLAWRLGVPFVGGEVDVPARARAASVSLEMAGRGARYDFLRRAARDAGASCIATGHTADDQAETLLLRIVRGSGPQGLCGIPYRFEGGGLRLVRPLLDVTHRQAVLFLRAHRLGWREDESNRDTEFLRNRVRLEVLPLLEKRLNPSVRGALVRLARVMRDEEAWADSRAGDLFEECRKPGHPDLLAVAEFQRQPMAAKRRIVRLWLASCGVSPLACDFETVEALVSLADGSRVSGVVALPGGGRVQRRYDDLAWEPRARDAGAGRFRARLRVPGATVVSGAGLRVAVKRDRGFIRDAGRGAGALPAAACFSAAKVGRSPLIVRSWEPGDRIRPLGMSGSRKLQDLFVDQKVPRDRRASIPVLVCRGQVIWVPGYRIARGWEVEGPVSPSLRVTMRPTA